MKYQTKVLEKEAMQSTGKNGKAICDWANTDKVRFERRGPEGLEVIDIDTLEGLVRANPGDWVIKGVKGEFYPCKNEVFQQSYEPFVEPIPTQPPQASGNGPSDSSDGETGGGTGAPAPGESSKDKE